MISHWLQREYKEKKNQIKIALPFYFWLHYLLKLDNNFLVKKSQSYVRYLFIIQNIIAFFLNNLTIFLSLYLLDTTMNTKQVLVYNSYL